MQPYKLRPSKLSDAAEVATVFACSCKHAYSPFLPSALISRYTPEDQLERWTNHLSTLPSNHRIIVAASDEDDIFGFIEVGPSAEEHCGEVHYLFVWPASARNGVGSSLLSSGEQWLLEEGYTNSILWVFNDNKIGREFYTAKGWKQTGGEQEEPSLLRLGFHVMECKMEKELNGI
jgi:diamine N-acetyltransferase